MLVWGPDEDTVTAANEVRLRYIDAIDGIPNETRQPFADGMHRLRADPAGSRPDVPGHRQPAERASRASASSGCRPALATAAVGARGALRGGRRAGSDDPLPDPPRRGAPGGPVVDACQAPVKQACLLFGERLKALRRGGVPVDAIPDARWCELFDASRRAARCSGRRGSRSCARWPRRPTRPSRRVVASLAPRRGSRGGWREHVAAAVAGARPRLYAPGDDRLFRFSMGLAMRELRGKVPAREVADAVRTEIAAR